MGASSSDSASIVERAKDVCSALTIWARAQTDEDLRSCSSIVVQNLHLWANDPKNRQLHTLLARSTKRLEQAKQSSACVVQLRRSVKALRSSREPVALPPRWP